MIPHSWFQSAVRGDFHVTSSFSTSSFQTGKGGSRPSRAHERQRPATSPGTDDPSVEPRLQDRRDRPAPQRLAALREPHDSSLQPRGFGGTPRQAAFRPSAPRPRPLYQHPQGGRHHFAPGDGLRLQFLESAPVEGASAPENLGPAQPGISLSTHGQARHSLPAAPPYHGASAGSGRIRREKGVSGLSKKTPWPPRPGSTSSSSTSVKFISPRP